MAEAENQTYNIPLNTESRNKMRVFVSTDIPDNIKKEIRKIQEKIPEFKGKITETENLHLTLKFLGWVDEKEIDKIKERLREVKIKKFEAEIDSLGFFYPRIIWLHLTNVDSLQKAVDDSLVPLFDREERFMSHLTIARVKEVNDRKEFKNMLGRINVKNIKFEVKNFRLKKSTLTGKGPIYETLEEYSLI